MGFSVMKQGEFNIKDNNPGPVLPDYTRVDFAAYYDVNEIPTIQVNVENLTDELYFHTHIALTKLR